jgi:hypothetical protein
MSTHLPFEFTTISLVWSDCAELFASAHSGFPPAKWGRTMTRQFASRLRCLENSLHIHNVSFVFVCVCVCVCTVRSKERPALIRGKIYTIPRHILLENSKPSSNADSIIRVKINASTCLPNVENSIIRGLPKTL